MAPVTAVRLVTKMQRNSRWPGFYKLPIEERRRMAADLLGIGLDELQEALEGGLDHARADKIIENVVGTYALPFALALNVKVNGTDFIVPMVVEEPSVVAAASNASRMIREGGGFTADADEPVMTGQVQLDDVPNAARAIQTLLRHQGELCALGDASIPGLVTRGERLIHRATTGDRAQRTTNGVATGQAAGRANATRTPAAAASATAPPIRR